MKERTPETSKLFWQTGSLLFFQSFVANAHTQENARKDILKRGGQGGSGNREFPLRKHRKDFD